MSKRDVYSKTYLLPDGTYQYVSYATPIHYKDNSGTYTEINNEITDAVRAEGYKYTNTSNKWHAYFSEKLHDEGAVKITDGKYDISFALLGSTAATKVIKATELKKASDRSSISEYHQNLSDDNRAVLYENVIDYVDVSYTVKTDALKEDIVLKSQHAPSVFKFKLTTNGLMLEEKEGTIALVNAAGEEIFTFAPLFMEDANGKRSDNVSLSYTGVKNGYELTVSADTRFLRAADTAYPVVIDPSVMVTGSDVTYDTCVDEEYPNSNYYLSESMWTGGALGTNAMRTYLKFSIPYGILASQVTSAHIYLLKKDYQAPTIKAYAVSGNWSSSSVTWNAKPPFSSFDYSGAATNTVGNWYGLDVTTLIKGWLSAEYSYYGFVLKEPTENSSSQKTKFYSSDAPSPNKPELVINYISYGSRTYDYTIRDDINCMGYALECDTIFTENLLGIVRAGMVGYTLAEMEAYIASKCEALMNNEYYVGSSNWTRIDTYNSDINPGWYRAVFRVGFVDVDNDGVFDYNEDFDYHWWYQTYLGYWADKQGDEPSQYRIETEGLNPVDFEFTNGNVRYNSSGIFYQIRDIRDVEW